jgi:hypothetical protein
MKTHRTAVNQRFNVDLRRTGNLTAKTEFRLIFCPPDTRSGLKQRGPNLFSIIANRGYDPHSGNDNTPHCVLLCTCSLSDTLLLRMQLYAVT